MKAIVCRSYGPPDVLRLEEIERPAPGSGEVLIRIRTAAVNPYDWHMMRGKPGLIRLFMGLGRPKTDRTGVDGAGEVASIGPRVTQFKPRDRVFGSCKGSFAEYAVAAEKNLAELPAGTSFEEGASIPIAGLTALQALRDKGKVRAGQRVLINGAAGGVGTFAVQIARRYGAEVTGVCSARNVELVRSIGADHVIDYARADFTRSSICYDVIFDLVGNRSLADCRRALEPYGIYIGCGGGGPEAGTMQLLGRMIGQMAVGPFVSQKLVGVLAKSTKADMNILRDLLESGAVKPVVDRCYPLSETADAVRYLEQGHARGKVLITPV